MIVRLRLSRARGVPDGRRAGPERETPPAAPKADENLVTPKEMLEAVVACLQPACALLYAMALWRIGQDTGWLRHFAFEEGVLSHWQVWFVFAALLQTAVGALRKKLAGSDDEDQATQ
jgi:hypothetical protein